MFRSLVLLMVLSFIAITAGFSQRMEPMSGLVFLDGGRTDRLIREALDNDLSNDYYIFTYPMGVVATSWNGQVINRYTELIKGGIKKENEDIVFILNNEAGIADKDIPAYFEQNFNIGKAAYDKLKVINSTSLYDSIHPGGSITQIMQVYNRRLLFMQEAKSKSISHIPLPHKLVIFGEPEYFIPSYNGTIFNGSADDIFRDENGGGMFWSVDSEDMILRLNYENGNMAPIFRSMPYNAADIFCKNLSYGDTTKCKFAKDNEHIWTSINRQMINLREIYQLDNEIYAGTYISAVLPNEEVAKYRNSDNEKVTVNIGDPTMITHSVIHKVDDDPFNEEVYLVHQKMNHFKGYNNLDWMVVDRGFMVLPDNKIIVTVLFNKKPGLFKRKSAFVECKLKNNKVVADRFSKFKISRKIWKYKEHTWFRTCFADFNGRNLIAYNSTGLIMEFDSAKVSSTFTGDGRPLLKKETYQKYATQNVEFKTNFTIFSMKGILNDQYLAAVYDYQRELVLEIKDKDLNTVQVTPLDFDAFAMFDSYKSPTVAIGNDAIIFAVIKDGLVQLCRVPLVLNQ